jgi:hypothetical protein
LSEVATKAKPKPKRKVERYTFDGVAVELRQVDPDKREAAPGDFMAGPAQRSKWEVHIDGVHHGYVFYPLGVGNPWLGCLLEPQDLIDYSDGDGVRCWLGPTGEHGGWEETGGKWDGLLGLLKKLEAPDDLKQRGNSSYGFGIAPPRPRPSRVLTEPARSRMRDASMRRLPKLAPIESAESVRMRSAPPAMPAKPKRTASAAHARRRRPKNCARKCSPASCRSRSASTVNSPTWR